MVAHRRRTHAMPLPPIWPTVPYGHVLFGALTPAMMAPEPPIRDDPSMMMVLASVQQRHHDAAERAVKLGIVVVLPVENGTTYRSLIKSMRTIYGLRHHCLHPVPGIARTGPSMPHTIPHPARHTQRSRVVNSRLQTCAHIACHHLYTLGPSITRHYRAGVSNRASSASSSCTVSCGFSTRTPIAPASTAG